MPLVFLEQLPLPTLQSYVSVSVLLFVSSFLYAFNNVAIWSSNDTQQTENEESTLYNFMTSDNFCFWANLNMAYCCLFMFGKVIQRIVFGDLRVAELQQIQDKFWNFVFYKFIFIFGVLNVQKMNEVMWWSAWFTLLGFFHLFTQLCKDRFEYLSFSPTTTPMTHGKIAGLLLVLLFFCNGLFFLAIFVGWPDGIHTFTFMLAECVMLLIKAVHVLILYGIHLWDIGHVGTWEGRSTWSYYTDLLLDIGICAVDFAHHLHMLLWSNIFLSMASLVLCMQIRHLFYEIKKRLARHRNFIRILKCTETRFPEATAEELQLNNDDCAICWDAMEKARKLPCGHYFHSTCLRSWLENDTTCPTCRMSLADDLQPEADEEQQPRGMRAFMMGRGIRRNHFFHFDGSQIASWFPSFSVEVVHTHTVNTENLQLPESRMEAMAHQVQTLFPNVPINIILDDLRQTHSIELTTDNFLEGRIAVPSIWTPPEEQAAGEASELLPVASRNDAQTEGQVTEYQTSADAEERGEEILPPDRGWVVSYQERGGLRLRRPDVAIESTSTDTHTDAQTHNIDDTRLASITRHAAAAEERRLHVAEEKMTQQGTMKSEGPLSGRRSPSPEHADECSRFHSEPELRHTSLSRRKEMMMEQARRNFLAKDTSSQASSPHHDWAPS